MKRCALSLKLDASPARDRAKVVLIAFPLKNNKASAPLIGNPTSPIIIPAWQNLDAVLVWSVDTTPRGVAELTLSAEFQPENRIRPAKHIF